MLRRMKPGAGPLKKGRRRKMRRLGIQSTLWGLAKRRFFFSRGPKNGYFENTRLIIRSVFKNNSKSYEGKKSLFETKNFLTSFHILK